MAPADPHSGGGPQQVAPARALGEHRDPIPDYHGLDGDALKAWLILPVDYEQGRRYPLVTSIYPGAVFADAAPPMWMLSLSGHHALNPQLLCARGYVVLLPSMPLKPEAEPSDPYMELTKGVLPAVDKVIEMGIADPDRLGLMGQSYGGYGWLDQFLMPSAVPSDGEAR